MGSAVGVRGVMESAGGGGGGGGDTPDRYIYLMIRLWHTVQTVVRYLQIKHSRSEGWVKQS
jgi:hypothetical protein